MKKGPPFIGTDPEGTVVILEDSTWTTKTEKHWHEFEGTNIRLQAIETMCKPDLIVVNQPLPLAIVARVPDSVRYVRWDEKLGKHVVVPAGPAAGEVLQDGTTAPAGAMRALTIYTSTNTHRQSEKIRWRRS